MKAIKKVNNLEFLNAKNTATSAARMFAQTNISDGFLLSFNSGQLNLNGVKDMSYMFEGAVFGTSYVDLSSLKTDYASNMQGMFMNASIDDQLPDVKYSKLQFTGFKGGDRVFFDDKYVSAEDMNDHTFDSMFANLRNVHTLDIRHWIFARNQLQELFNEGMTANMFNNAHVTEVLAINDKSGLVFPDTMVGEDTLNGMGEILGSNGTTLNY